MIKKINKIYSALLLVMAFVATSCGPEIENPIYSDGAYLVFSQSQASVGDGNPGEGNEVRAKVIRGGTSNYSTDLTVNYTLTATLSDGSNGSDRITDESAGSITIPAGSPSEDIVLRTVGNAEVGDLSVTVVIQITSVTDASLSIGFRGPDALSSTFTLTILDDDCLISLAPAYANIVNGNQAAARTVTIVENADGSYRISDMHGYVTNLGNPLAVGGNFTIDANNNVTIPPQVAFGVLNYSGSGSFNTCNNILTYTLTENFFGNVTNHEVIVR